jgi:hypothetical protein
MAESAGWATLDVIPSVKGLARELDKQTSGDLATAGRRGGKKFGDAAGTEAATGFKARFQNGVRDLNPLGGVAIGAGLALGLKDIYTRASQAQQSVGGVQSVFKEYADSVIADSKRADQALGLSTTAYQELITVTGALLKNKGLEDYAEQAEGLIGIGADLSAMFGGTTKEAVEALNAAMRGESDPIERYAISLNETAVNAQLAATGMSGLKGAALDQAKAQARLELIVQQSADAQGAFARESDTAAGASARTTAQFENMRAELGTKLLPAATSFFGFLNNEALPALSSAGGFAADAARAFRDLPAPVQASAAAFVALRVAAGTGLTSGLASGAGRASSVLETLRLRAMLAADEFTNARTVTRQFGDSSARVSSGVGRLSASMAALRAGAQGAGAGITRGLGGAMSLLGGPWGVAMIAGTALLTKFWQEHQESKARIDEHTSALDKQTGALTENNREIAFKALQDAGAITAARDLGISLATVTDAALGNRDAIADVTRVVDQYGQTSQIISQEGDAIIVTTNKNAEAANKLRDAIGGSNEELSKSRQEFRDHAAAMGGSTDATKEAAAEYGSYADEIRKVRSELQKLIDKEQERALNAIQNRRDQIALRETLAAAREEAAEGKRVLFGNTQAANENMSALLDLADQWANSTPKVANAQGAYEDMRQKFIRVAESMGATRGEARKLADELLKVPKTAPVEFQSKGYRERMREIAAIKAAMEDLGSASLDFTPRGFGRADGGGTLTTTTPAAPGRTVDTSPRGGITNNFYGGIHGSTIPEITKHAERSNQRRGHGGFGR